MKTPTTKAVLRNGEPFFFIDSKERVNLIGMLTAILASFVTQTAPKNLQILDTVAGNPSSRVRPGDLVTVDFKRWIYESGAPLDLGDKKPPLAFWIGEKPPLPFWPDALKDMAVGATRVAIVPANLAYGTRGLGEIPGNATIGFEINLLRIDKKNAKSEIRTDEMQAGTGTVAMTGDTVELHYIGSFLNGVKFDSSRDRNQRFSFELGKARVIKGFEQGVIGMRVGQRRKVTIPYDLAYGEKGAGDVIPPYSTLVFDLELYSVKKPAAP